jgi:DNA-directed RNA polymerase beta' subunit
MMAREFDLTGYLYGPEPDAAPTPAILHVRIQTGALPGTEVSHLTPRTPLNMQNGDTLTLNYTLTVSDD